MYKAPRSYEKSYTKINYSKLMISFNNKMLSQINALSFSLIAFPKAELNDWLSLTAVLFECFNM